MLGTDTNKANISNEKVKELSVPLCAFYTEQTHHDSESHLLSWLATHKNDTSALILACAISPQWESKIPYTPLKAARQVREYQTSLGKKQFELTALKARLLDKYPNLQIDIQVRTGTPVTVATEICRQFRCRNILIIGANNRTWWQQIRRRLASSATTIELLSND